MNKIYQEISNLSSKFREMCYGLTQDEESINDAVQELMLYYLQMNPETLKGIWEKDGQEGLIRYGAVVLRRSLTSARSPFYYKYKKYYTHISKYYETNVTDNLKSIYNMPEVVEEYKWTKLEEIDQVLDKQTWYDKKVFELTLDMSGSICRESFELEAAGEPSTRLLPRELVDQRLVC